MFLNRGTVPHLRVGPGRPLRPRRHRRQVISWALDQLQHQVWNPHQVVVRLMTHQWPPQVYKLKIKLQISWHLLWVIWVWLFQVHVIMNYENFVKLKTRLRNNRSEQKNLGLTMCNNENCINFVKSACFVQNHTLKMFSRNSIVWSLRIFCIPWALIREINFTVKLFTADEVDFTENFL